MLLSYFKILFPKKPRNIQIFINTYTVASHSKIAMYMVPLNMHAGKFMLQLKT